MSHETCAPKYVQSASGPSYLRYPAGILEACMDRKPLKDTYPCVVEPGTNPQFHDAADQWTCNPTFCSRGIPRNQCTTKGMKSPEECHADCCQTLFRSGWVMNTTGSCEQVLCVPPTPGQEARDPQFTPQPGCFASLAECSSSISNA